MRRRRAGLQVNTFPFLAVLLCAMGSLILLLLVIDRRAKIVARNKAQEQARVAGSQDEKLKKEWERQRRALHALLAGQDAELKKQLRDLRSQSDLASKKLWDEQARFQNTEKALSRGKNELERLRKNMAQWRTAVVQATREDEKSQQAIQQLARELNELERTLEALRLLRRRQEQAFSLVPYGGKRGDARKPIYVECTRSGLTFFPQPRTIPDFAIGLAQIRSEADKRMESRNQAYLLFLVRPDGIAAYTLAQNSLRGSAIDYGYELVEPDWEFDFASEERLASQPWQASQAEIGFAAQGPGNTLGPPRSVPPALTFNRGGAGTGMGGTEPGSRSGFGNGTKPGAGRFPSVSGGTFNGSGDGTGMGGRASGSGIGFGNATRPGAGFPGASGVPRPPGLTFNGSGDGTGMGGSEPGPGIGIGNGTNPGAGFPGASSVPQPPGSTFYGSGDGTGVGQSTGIGQGPGAPPGPWRNATSSWPGMAPGAPGAGQAASGNVAGRNGNPSNGGASAGGNGGSFSNGGVAGTPGVALGSPDTGVRPGQGGSESQTSGADAAAPSLACRAQVAGDGASGSAPWKGQVGNLPHEKPSPEQAGSPSDEPQRFAGFGPPGDGEAGGSPGLPQLGGPRLDVPKAKARPAVPLSRMLGNRDYPIVLECTEEAIVIQPWGIRFENSTVPMRPDPNHPLVQTMNKLVSRRQATVRQGEPPYRPVLRFQIRPGGLRSYYLAYPMLESLQLPMTRENIGEER